MKVPQYIVLPNADYRANNKPNHMHFSQDRLAARQNERQVYQILHQLHCSNKGTIKAKCYIRVQSLIMHIHSCNLSLQLKKYILWEYYQQLRFKPAFTLCQNTSMLAIG